MKKNRLKRSDSDSSLVSDKIMQLYAIIIDLLNVSCIINESVVISFVVYVVRIARARSVRTLPRAPASREWKHLQHTLEEEREREREKGGGESFVTRILSFFTSSSLPEPLVFPRTWLRSQPGSGTSASGFRTMSLGRIWPTPRPGWSTRKPATCSPRCRWP